MIDIKKLERRTLFYNKFTYSVRFYLPHCYCLRPLESEWLEKNIILAKNRIGRLSAFLAPELTPLQESRLRQMFDLLSMQRSNNTEFKVAVSDHYCTIYTNDIGLLNVLDNSGLMQRPSYNQAIQNCASGTILLKNSEYKYRTYLRSKKLDSQEKFILSQYLVNVSDDIRLSPSLDRWAHNSYLWTQNNFFIDHNDPQWNLMLSIIASGIIGKTLAIVR
jgi:hypothetical protein